ncbi:ABC transporter type 1, transmembrane domain-containing protein [Suillus fuscotomentosus]|uniref:ABC transporter type 1, transmembrane domain-containing protein n=1 Tax=Suillus fuscotomentosus TaxID=1912939 RepID=A0AAD4EEN2_9AGAM|nr:ABC transporter type 1, transmembrane domain-containing protein [Suillus fuscotomentosus]KAG1904761.1 ABC transporter type 1, transmembrane domain-containing protein [Suillus fuscotomentosus]
MHSVQEPWFSGQLHNVPFGTWCPAVITILAIVIDFLARRQLPKIIQVTWSALSAPFRNFITLDDVEGPFDDDFPQQIWIIRALVSIALLSSFSWLAYFGYTIVLQEPWTNALVASIAWFYATLTLLLRAPSTPPYMLILLAVSQIAAACIYYFSLPDYAAGPMIVILIRTISSATFVYVAGLLPLQAVRPALNVASSTNIPSSNLSSPEDDANLWSWCTVSFVEPILDLAWKRTLNDADVWSLSPFFRHKNLFNKCLRYRSRYPTHSLLRFLLVSNSLDLILDLALEMWGAVVGFVPAYALRMILSSLDNPTPESVANAKYWAFLTFVAHLSFAQVDLFKNWHTRRCYERTRGQLFCALHYKALRRRDISGKTSSDEEGSADLGKIVNLMQGDAYAVAQRFWDFAAIFSSPLRLVIALVFLYKILGWSAMSGVVVILFAYILNYPLATYNIKITRASWKAKDKRMNVVNELLQNIRFLKFYGWGTRRELDWRVKENVVDTIISFIWTWIPSATALATFSWYTLGEQEQLTVSKAFTAVALFSQLQEPMTALPGQFFAMLHAYVSMQRIEGLLAEQEVPEWALSLSTVDTGSEADFSDIGFNNATFEWHGVHKESMTETHFQLGPLDIKFPKGQLSLISGATGAGKSAMLTALLGEMHCLSGDVFINKRRHQVAYCAQTPCKDNIIFGSKLGFNEARYHAVVEACALERDLAVFEAGDMTEIGEKGITLSGGQRARIALARAMYSEANCILLDDPLAAVDMHTAQHIVQHCLSGELARDRTIILVTHHISLCLPIASYVVELSRGSIARAGDKEEFQDVGEVDALNEVDDEETEVATSGIQTPDDNMTKDVLPMQRPSQTARKLVEAEVRAEGRVPFRTYWVYIKAAGLMSWALTLVLMLMIRMINIGNQVFLAKWGESYDVSASVFLPNVKYPWDDLPPPDVNVKPWLLIYLYISIAGAFSVLAYISLGYYASLQASRSLFLRLLQRLTRAPARFFDTTPIGRILNRFTTDINTIDGALQTSARAALSGVLNFLASFTVIIVVIPAFAPLALVIAWLYIRIAPRFVQAQRDLRRLESVALSPAFAGFDELLRGLSHVRAFAMESRYQDKFYEKVDKFQSYDHVYWLVNGWLRWRYDCLGSVVVYLTTLFALSQGVSNGSSAIVIVQAGIFAEASRQLVRVLAQLELDFNAVERVVEYLDVPQEAPAIIEKSRPPAYWPSSDGQLVVENLVVRYSPDLPDVLKNISFVVQPSEKIGVASAGRIMYVILGVLLLVPASEHFCSIDGIDISTIGLEDLRSRITIVSQDVSLFSGTLRSNLDPFEEHTDQECWDVLERCHLTRLLSRAIEKGGFTLEMPISQGGSLSAGERQLVALARAVLRKTNIIIMDEATSQIDSRLDDQIQTTIREELSGALIITIAHRLKTIIDYDRILVLDAGEIIEFDEPKVLLAKVGGAFREMCRKSADWPQLFASMER